MVETLSLRRWLGASHPNSRVKITL